MEKIIFEVNIVGLEDHPAVKIRQGASVYPYRLRTKEEIIKSMIERKYHTWGDPNKL